MRIKDPFDSGGNAYVLDETLQPWKHAILSAGIEELPAVVGGFVVWPCERGTESSQWTACINKFDEFLEAASKRSQADVDLSDCLPILRFLKLLADNCSKSKFTINSWEHLLALAMCRHRAVAIETLALVAALGMRGGSSLKAAVWNSALSVLCDAPLSLCSYGRNEPSYCNFMCDTFDPREAFGEADLLYTWASSDGTVFQIQIPPLSKNDDAFAVADAIVQQWISENGSSLQPAADRDPAALSPEKKSQQLQMFTFAVRTRVQLLHELWDKDARIERLAVRLTASRACFESPRLAASSAFSILQMASIIDCPQTPKDIRVAATSTLSHAIASKLDHGEVGEVPLEVMQLLALPNPLYKWFVSSSLHALSGSHDRDALRELAVLVNILAIICVSPSLVTHLLNNGIISDVIPLLRIHPCFDHNIVDFACVILEKLLDSPNNNVQTQSQRCIRSLDVTGIVLSSISTFISSACAPLSACCLSSLSKLCSFVSILLRYIPGSDQRILIRNEVIPILVSVAQSRMLFGPSVFASVCYLMHSSLNIDPNSLQIMLEKGVVDLYLGAIQERGRVVVLSLQELPQLINALCLTEAGRNRVEATNCISHVFMMCFEPDAVYLNSHSHVKSLKQTVNELLRHHRPLVPVVVEVLRSSVRASFHLTRASFRDPSIDQCIGLRNMTHCYFSMLSGASSFVFEHVHSIGADIIRALADFAALVNELPHFWVSSAAEVFCKFFGAVLHVSGRPQSMNAECITAFAEKWTCAIESSSSSIFKDFLFCGCFSGILIPVLNRVPFAGEYRLLFRPVVYVLAQCVAQKLKGSSELNLLDVFDETGSYHSRDVLRMFFSHSCDVLHGFCSGLFNANKQERNSPLAAFSRTEMSDMASILMKSVSETLKSCSCPRDFATMYSIPDDQRTSALFYSFRLNFLKRILQELLCCPKIVLLGHSSDFHDILIDIFRDSCCALSGAPGPTSDDAICQKRSRSGALLSHRSSALLPQGSLEDMLCDGQSELRCVADGPELASDCDELHSAVLMLISKFYGSLLGENVVALGNSPPAPWNDESAEYLEHLAFGSVSVKNGLVNRILKDSSSAHDQYVNGDLLLPRHIDVLTSCHFGIFAACVADDDVVIFSSLQNRRHSQFLDSAVPKKSLSERLVDLPLVYRSALDCIMFALTRTTCDVDPCFEVIRKMSQFFVLEFSPLRPFEWNSWPASNHVTTRCLRLENHVSGYQKILQKHYDMIDTAINLHQMKTSEQALSTQGTMFPLSTLCDDIAHQLGQSPSRGVKRSLLRCALFVAQSMTEHVAMLEPSLRKIVEICVLQHAMDKVPTDELKPTMHNNGDYSAPLLLIADILFNVMSRSKCTSDYLKQVANAIKHASSSPVETGRISASLKSFISSVLNVARTVVSQAYLHVTLTIVDKGQRDGDAFSVRVDVPRSVLFLSGSDQARELSKLINNAAQAFSAKFCISDPVVCTYDPNFVSLNGNGFVLFKFCERKDAGLNYSVNVHTFPTSESMNAALQTTFRCVNLFGTAIVSPEFRSDFIRATLTPHINVAYPMLCNQCLWLFEVFSQEGTYLREVIDRKIYECLQAPPGAGDGKRLHDLFASLGQITYRSPSQVIASIKALCLISQDADPRRFPKELRVKLKKFDPRSATPVWLPTYHGADASLFAVSLCEIVCDFASQFCHHSVHGSPTTSADDLYGIGAFWNPHTIVDVLYADFLNSADSKCHPLFASVIVDKCLVSDGRLLENLAKFGFQGRWSGKGIGKFLTNPGGGALSPSFKLFKLLCEHSVPFRHVLVQKHISGIFRHFLSLDHPESKDYSIVAGAANFLASILKRRSPSIPDKKIITFAGEIVDFGVLECMAQIISELGNKAPIERCLCDILVQSSCAIVQEAAFSETLNSSQATTGYLPRQSALDIAGALSADHSASVADSGAERRSCDNMGQGTGDGEPLVAPFIQEPIIEHEGIRIVEDMISSDGMNEDQFLDYGFGHEGEEYGGGADEDGRYIVQELRSSDSSSSDDEDDVGIEHIDEDNDNHNDNDDDDDDDEDDDDDDDNNDDSSSSSGSGSSSDDDDNEVVNSDPMIQLVSQVIQRDLQGSSSRAQNTRDLVDNPAASFTEIRRYVDDEQQNSSVLARPADTAFLHPRNSIDEMDFGLPLSGRERSNFMSDAFMQDREFLDDLARPSEIFEDVLQFPGWEPDSIYRADSRLFSSIIRERYAVRSSVDVDISDLESDAAGENTGLLNVRSRESVIGRPLGRFPSMHSSQEITSNTDWVNPLFGSVYSQNNSTSAFAAGDSVFGHRARAHSWLTRNSREGRFGRTNPLTTQSRGNLDFNILPQSWHVLNVMQSRNGDVEVACRTVLERELPATDPVAEESNSRQPDQRSTPLARTNSARAISSSLSNHDNERDMWTILRHSSRAYRDQSSDEVVSRAMSEAEFNHSSWSGWALSPREPASSSGLGLNDPLSESLSSGQLARDTRSPASAASLLVGVRAHAALTTGSELQPRDCDAGISVGDAARAFTTASEIAGIDGLFEAGTAQTLAENVLMRQAMNEARQTIEQARAANPGIDSIGTTSSAQATVVPSSGDNHVVLESALENSEEEDELREALALSMEYGGPSSEHESGALQASSFRSPPSIGTPNASSSVLASSFVGTPALSEHEMSEIQGTDIDANVLAELPVELRAGIIAQHRAVSRSNPTTPALGPIANSAAIARVPPLFGAGLDVPDGVDPEYFNQLPPDVQADVREQQRRTRSASSTIPNEVSLDLAAIIASFPPSARADALLALPEEAVQTLSRELQDEVRSLRGTHQSRQQLPDRSAGVARGRSASETGYLSLDSSRYGWGSRPLTGEGGWGSGRLRAGEGIEGRPLDTSHFRQLVHHMNIGSGDPLSRIPFENDLMPRSGRVRSLETPVVRCPISPDVVSIITTACCSFPIPRNTFKFVASLLRVSFHDPLCVSAFLSACNQIFDPNCPQAHVANIHNLIKRLCSDMTANAQPSFVRAHARRLAALLDTSHPVLVQKFVRSLLHQVSTRSSLRPCLSDTLYTFSYVLLEALKRMGPLAAEYVNSQHPVKDAVVRHVSSDSSLANSSGIVSLWLKSSEEQCEWIEPLESSLFLSILKASSEPEFSDYDALELCSHLLRFHMHYDQFVLSFLPALESLVISLCDTISSSLSSSTSNLSIVQLPADDIRLVRLLLIINNCFDASSIQWAADKDLTFVGVSPNSSSISSTFEPLLNILLRVSQHPVWIRVGVSLKEQERSSSSRRVANDGAAAAGDSVPAFQSSGLARLHSMLEAFFIIHKPMGSGFSDAVEKRSKLRMSRLANPVRSEEIGVMARSDSTMGIGHMGHMRSESSGNMPSSPPAVAVSASQSVEPTERDAFDSGVDAFVEFIFAHVNVVNMFVRLKPSVLSGSLSIIQRLPMLLDFENRKSLFRKELSKRDRSVGQSRASLPLVVKRGQVYSDSFRHLNHRSADELKAKLSVKFEGEEGADYGGLTREWYLVLSREMLNPDIGLFVPSQGSKLAFQCNPASDVIFAHDNFVHFRFVGRIVGKALYDNMLLDAHFTRAMYKAMLRLPISLSDVQDTEPEVFKSLHWLLHNDVSDLDLTFATESEKFGVLETVELKEGGSSISVTNENKVEYVKLLSEHRLRNSVRKQMQEFLAGFHELIPLDLIPMFSPAELELLMCGLPNVDREDLRANTEYCGAYTRDSPQIQWFWRCVAEMSDEDTAKVICCPQWPLCKRVLLELVQFATGTSNVPLEGFSSLQGMHGPQRFQIHKSDRLELLPTAHTCFNQLDLPAYGSYETLKSMLLTAIRSVCEQFCVQLAYFCPMFSDNLEKRRKLRLWIHLMYVQIACC